MTNSLTRAPVVAVSFILPYSVASATEWSEIHHISRQRAVRLLVEIIFRTLLNSILEEYFRYCFGMNIRLSSHQDIFIRQSHGIARQTSTLLSMSWKYPPERLASLSPPACRGLPLLSLPILVTVRLPIFCHRKAAATEHSLCDIDSLSTDKDQSVSD